MLTSTVRRRRLACAAGVLPLAVWAALGTPAFFRQLRQVCPSETGICATYERPTPESLAVLDRLGVSLTGYAVTVGARGYLLRTPSRAASWRRCGRWPPGSRSSRPRLPGCCSDALIGRRLGLRPKTVRNYVSNVLAKLHAADRAEAVLRARDAGLGTPASGEPGDRSRSGRASSG